jgi:hypothetical protein
MLQKELISDFLKKADRVLIDTNPFFLFMVGTISPTLISNFKRLRIFKGKEVETFNILYNILKNYNEFITLPNILTEVNSFAKQADAKSREQFFQYFSNFLGEEIGFLKEKYVKSALVVKDKRFLRLHLTDTTILNLVEEENIGTITMDFALYKELADQNYPVLNFNHLVPWLL